MATTTTTTLTGYTAIGYAEIHGLTLSKYADPIEEAREGLTVAEAMGIAAEDPGLVYLEAPAGALVFYITDEETAAPVEAASAREAVETYLDNYDFGDVPTVSGEVYLRPTDYSDPANHLASFTGAEGKGVTDYHEF